MQHKFNKTIPTTYSPKIEGDEEYEQTIVPFFPKRKPYQHYEHTFTSQHIHFYLNEAIGDAPDYTDMVHRMYTATEADVVYIHLNTPGGSLETGVQILNAIQNSAAHVITILESTAYSLGTLIFLAGDEMVVNDNCMMMFHNFRGGVVGVGHEMVAELEATIKWFASLAKKIYIPFLTEDEFDRIVRGEDMWMQSSEIRRRLSKMSKKDEQVEEVQKPVRKPRTKKKPAEEQTTEK